MSNQIDAAIGWMMIVMAFAGGMVVGHIGYLREGLIVLLIMVMIATWLAPGEA